MKIQKKHQYKHKTVYGMVRPLIHQAGLTSIIVNTGLPYPPTYTNWGITFNVVNNGSNTITFSDGIESIIFIDNLTP